MRAVPSSWIAIPGISTFAWTRMSFAPADSSISAPVAFGAHVEFRARSALIAIPADETRMLVTRRSVPEPRNVNPVRPLRLIGIGKCLKIRQTARGASANDVVHQIMTERAARVGQSFGIFPRRRIQQDARGFERLRTQDHSLSTNLLNLSRQTIDIRYALRLVQRIIHIHVAHHGIGDERALT